MTSIKDVILKSSIKQEKVELKDLGITVTLQEMDAARMEQYERLIYKIDDDGNLNIDTKNLKSKMVAFSVVDDNGNLIFTAEDVEKLARSRGGVVKKLSDVAGKLNGLYNEEKAKKN